MRNIFLCLGSNIDDRLGYLQLAVYHIHRLPGTSILNLSSIYETEPVGKKNQANFLNMVAEVRSDLAPERLLQQLKSLEKRLGRIQTDRWGPREIDIDILYAGDVIVNKPDFKIPHAEVVNRRFALLPLVEIAGDFLDPVLKVTISELLQTCRDQSLVRKTEYSTHLQEH